MIVHYEGIAIDVPKGFSVGWDARGEFHVVANGVQPAAKGKVTVSTKASAGKGANAHTGQAKIWRDTMSKASTGSSVLVPGLHSRNVAGFKLAMKSAGIKVSISRKGVWGKSIYYASKK